MLRCLLPVTRLETTNAKMKKYDVPRSEDFQADEWQGMSEEQFDSAVMQMQVLLPVIETRIREGREAHGESRSAMMQFWTGFVAVKQDIKFNEKKNKLKFPEHLLKRHETFEELGNKIKAIMDDEKALGMGISAWWRPTNEITFYRGRPQTTAVWPC